MRLLLTFILALTTSVRAAEDPREIVRKSVSHDRRNWELAKSYIYVERTFFREFDDEGKVKRTRHHAHEVLNLYGQNYRKLVERDGKPLPVAEARLEDEKLNKAMAERQHESSEKRQKREAEFERDRQRMRSVVQEVPDAFDFRLVGEEKIDGRDNWVIEGTPRPDFHAKDSRARMFSRFRGKLWIDKAEYQCTRVQAEAIDSISFYLFLARINKGSRLEIDLRKVNDEIWMPRHVFVAFSARIAIFKKFIGDEQLDYLNYRKFQAESKIVSTGESAVH